MVELPDLWVAMSAVTSKRQFREEVERGMFSFVVM